MSNEMKLIYPGIVPIRILSRLGRAGIHTDKEVHEQIRAGTLRQLPGIGKAYERDILHYYTDSPRGEWRG